MSRKERLQKIEQHIIYNAMNNRYTCGACNKDFSRKDSLQNHFENFHMTHQGYDCEYCGKKFNGKNNLRVHKHMQHRNFAQK